MTGIRIKNVQNGATEDITLRGCFIAIGHTPNTGIFEGQLQMLIGLDQEVPFRVITLDDPVRLVLDFRTD